MHTFIIDVADDFCLLPTGRTEADGAYNATTFFKSMHTKVKVYGKVILCFKNVLGVGSSFLHEIAKLAVLNNIDTNVIVVADDEHIKERYNRYVKEAKYG